MAEHRGTCGDNGHIRPVLGGEQHGGNAFAAVADQRRHCQSLATGPQHIGRADTAGADGTDVTVPGEPCQDQPEGDGAEQIGRESAGIERPRIFKRSQKVRHRGISVAPAQARSRYRKPDCRPDRCVRRGPARGARRTACFWIYRATHPCRSGRPGSDRTG